MRLIVQCSILIASFVLSSIAQDRMAWWRDARFGMFIHWGAYAQLHGWWNSRQTTGLGEWIMNDMAISIPNYETNAAAPFNPTQFNAVSWVNAARNAGQKYIVITSKHHEGFSMFATAVARFSPYDIVDYTPWKQDPLAALSAECRNQGVRFCVYYSIMDWHHPSQSNYGATMSNKTQYVTDMKAQLQELISKYDPDVIWFDGEWQSWWTTADGNDLHQYLLGLKPTLIVNNRIGKRALTDGDFGTPEQTIPSDGLDYDWESCMTINDTWGYEDFDVNWKTSLTLLTNLADCASKGGNFLLNIGPAQTGIIPQPEVVRLDTMGQWLAIYGESIYGTRASIFPSAFSWGKVTVKRGKVFLHVITWPGGSHQITIPALKNTVSKVYLLNDTNVTCAYTVSASSMTITLPATAPNKYISVVAIAVNGEPRASDSLYINNTNAAVTYYGTWNYSAGRGLGDYKDDVHYSQTNNDSCIVTFNGIGVDYITERNTDEGNVDLYIDGVFTATVNCYNASRQTQQVVLHRDLASGTHTLRAVKRSGTYMLFDALRIRIDPAAVPVVRRNPAPAAPVKEPVIRARASGNTFRFTVKNITGGFNGFSFKLFGLDGVLVRDLNSLKTCAWELSGIPLGVYCYSFTVTRNASRTGTWSGVIHLVR